MLNFLTAVGLIFGVMFAVGYGGHAVWALARWALHHRDESLKDSWQYVRDESASSGVGY